MGFFIDDIARERFIILYFLSESNLALTNNQITTVMLQNEWADYFSLQQSLTFFCENGLIAQISRPLGMCYAISEAGRQAVSQFSHRLAQSQREEISVFIQDNKPKLLLQAQNIASFQKNNEKEFIVTCKIVEGNTELLDMRLSVPTRHIAARLVNQWKANAQDAYGEILKLLG